ncbi:hypothetical protein XarbCFBP6827_19075 [Xanthomonas arboricola]|nr:hypothetical protein XarbCFBP6827_19075 [Xanthomonas arboricola]
MQSHGDFMVVPEREDSSRLIAMERRPGQSMHCLAEPLEQFEASLLIRLVALEGHIASFQSQEFSISPIKGNEERGVSLRYRVTL